MNRTSAVIILALLAQGCWADFPDERFMQDGAQADASVIDTTVQPDAGQDTGFDAQIPDAPADGTPPDTMAPDTAADTVAPDTAADTAAADTAADTLPPDTAAPDTVAPDTAAPDTVAPDTAAPDTVVPDTVPPDTVPPDSFSCVPDAFILCSSTTSVLRCNTTGDNVVSEDCSPYLCNATAGRCNECNPGDPPWCENNDLANCLANGLKQITACGALGCQSGACCYNSDGDSVTTCDTPPDCNDNDPDIFPGQTAYFTTASGGSFDYDCDGSEEQQWTAMVACTSFPGCVGEGWDDATMTQPPACGVAGDWAICSKGGGGNCDITTQSQTQACQ